MVDFVNAYGLQVQSSTRRKKSTSSMTGAVFRTTTPHIGSLMGSPTNIAQKSTQQFTQGRNSSSRMTPDVSSFNLQGFKASTSLTTKRIPVQKDASFSKTSLSKRASKSSQQKVVNQTSRAQTAASTRGHYTSLSGWQNTYIR